MRKHRVVNFEKSCISFNPNMTMGVRDEIQSRLRVGRAQPYGMNLRLPSLVGTNRRRAFTKLRDRLWQRLQTWKGRLFSKKGKEILLKAVALSLPNYAMEVFRLPDSVCSDMEATMARFWWRGSLESRSLHWRK